MIQEFTITRKFYQPTDPRLKRHVNHDSRSLNYPVQAAPDPTKLKSVRHERFIPILDQKKLGSCTGNAGTYNLAMGIFWDTVQDLVTAGKLSASNATLDEQYAIDLYSAATKIDPFGGTYPPTDTGSDGLSIAKVLKAWGRISGYQHALSLEAALTALAEKAVIAGIPWFDDMFYPNSQGQLKITGSLAGGHEIVLSELDVENRRVWLDNQWNESWGQKGRAWLTWDDFGTLMHQQGDVTVFTPNNKPAPTPTPPQPQPEPKPTPPAPPTPPQPTPEDEFNLAAKAFAPALDKYLKHLNA